MTSATLSRSLPSTRVEQAPLLVLVAVVGAASIALGTWLPWNSHWPDPTPVATAQILVGTLVTSLWLVACLVALARDARGPLWGLLLGYVLVVEWPWILQYVEDPLTYAVGQTFQSLGTAVLVHALVAFPSGRLVSTFDRRVVAGVYAFTFLADLVHGVTWNPTWTDWPYRNVLAVLPNDDVGTVQGIVDAVAIPLIGIIVVAAVVRHWRDASPAARRIVAPAMVALPFLYLTSVVGYVGDNLGIQALSDLGRHPLLLACPAIVPLGYLLGTARSRLSRARVADLVVELGGGAASLRDVLARALGDPGLEVAYPAEPDAWVNAAGQPIVLPAPGDDRVATPITSDRGILAMLVHDAAIDTESPGLVVAVGSAARLALENERLSAEVRAQLEDVRASRARLAEAAEEERRRLERDLHDGAQQRLVALTMRLEQARGSTTEASRLIDETTRELRSAVAEVRTLARGLHPPILDEAGLAAAIESLAERSPIPMDVEVPTVRLPPSIVATAYFVVAEAVTNAAKHARASHVRVAASIDDNGLQLTIADDGVGGADAAGGSGLRGLADRVAAAGGSLAIDSPAGGGTTITARLPRR